jgi:hypothetical protein
MNNPFRCWHIVQARTVTVAAQNTSDEVKRASHFVCDGTIPDNQMIQEALNSFATPFLGRFGWQEVQRKREWRFPWQPPVKFTKLADGGIVRLTGDFDYGRVSDAIN